MAELRPLGGRLTSTPTAGRRCSRVGASWRRCGAGFRPTISSRSRRRHCRFRPEMRPICTPSRPALWRRTGRNGRFICAPRRNSPARSCWPRASARIVEFARVFRNRERGALHHPEFTMVEWYRANEPYRALMDDCAAILALAAEAAGTQAVQLPRPHRRPVRHARADHGCRSVPRALPASICWRASRAANRIATASRATRPRPASASPPTTPGAIFSAACWSSASSPISASAAPPFSTNIRARSRRWRGRRAIRASPSASSFMSAASNSPTALAS